MNEIKIHGQKLSKSYGRRQVFGDLDFCFEGPGAFGIAGKNGAGKSTLALIIAGVRAASKGSIRTYINGTELMRDSIYRSVGFASPYLTLYDELSASENLDYCLKIRGMAPDKERAGYLLEKFDLYKRRNDCLKDFSSGMKQRVKLIFSMIHSPVILILDEPSTNLDLISRQSLYPVLEDYSSEHLVLIASNEPDDLKLCKSTLTLGGRG